MQVIIGGTDVTSAVQESTYMIDKVAKYQSWVDANNVEHRANLHYKVEGTFDMVFLPNYSMDCSDFLELVENNTDLNGVLPISLSVNNLDQEVVTINCFLSISFQPIMDTKNGSNVLVKRCSIGVKEC